MMLIRPLLPLLLFPAIASTLAADPKPALRVLRDQCVGCHKPGKAKGGLLLTTHEKMMKGGDNGVPVVPGKAVESLLYQVVAAQGDPHMPPKKQLSEPEVAALKTWIDAGAGWDATVFDEAPAARPVKLTTMPAAYQPVLALALSPDGKRLAFARAGEVLMTDLTKPERPVTGTLAGHIEAVQSLAWSPDGRFLVSGGYQRLTVWDATLLTKIRSIESRLIGPVTALVVGPNGSLYAADGEPGGAGFLHRFDLQQGAHQATWKAHDDTVYSLRLSAKGDRLLSGGADKLAKIWDTSTLKLVSSYEGHTNHVLGVAFNQDGSRIATAGADREIKVWDVPSREQDVSLGDKKTVFTGIAWTPDGKSLAVVSDKGGGSVYTELKKHNGEQRSETAKERKLAGVNETLTSVAITPDSKTVFAGGFNGTVYIWDAASGKAAGEIAP